MPRFDKTGPQGKGPKTGRGLGDCDSNTPSKEETSQQRPLRRLLGRRGIGRKSPNQDPMGRGGQGRRSR